MSPPTQTTACSSGVSAASATSNPASGPRPGGGRSSSSATPSGGGAGGAPVTSSTRPNSGRSTASWRSRKVRPSSVSAPLSTPAQAAAPAAGDDRRGHHGHSTLRIQAAPLLRAIWYSTVVIRAGSTSLRSMVSKPSFSPK